MNRYRFNKIKKNIDGYRFKESTLYPTFPPSHDDVYVISREGDRLDILAAKFYSDVSLWWIIAISNNIGKGSMIVEPGLQLRIPMNISKFNEKLESDNKG